MHTGEAQPTSEMGVDLAEVYAVARPSIPAHILPTRGAIPVYEEKEPGRQLDADEENTLEAWSERITGHLGGRALATFRKELAELKADMEDDPHLLGLCIDQMKEGLRDCDDRAFLMWQQVRTAQEVHRAASGQYDGAQVFAVGRGMYRLSEIDDYVAKRRGPTFLLQDETAEGILYARDLLRTSLSLPVPPAVGIGTGVAANSRDFNESAIRALGARIVRCEKENDQKPLRDFLASWLPMQTHLAANMPALREAHASINEYRYAVLDKLDAHNGGKLPVETHPPLNSAEYKARNDQLKSEAEQLMRAANLAAVEGMYFASFEGRLMQEMKMSNPRVGRQHVGALREAVARGSLDAEWTHPTYGWNAIHIAAAAGEAELTRSLAAAGVKIDVADRDGLSALHVAAANGYSDVAAALLAAGGEPNVPDARGYPPLHYAALSGKRVVVEALVSAGAEVNARDSRTGNTALHVAASRGDVSLVRALLSTGANPTIKAEDGKTARTYLESSDTSRASKSDYKLTLKALKESEIIWSKIGAGRAS